MPSHYKTVSKKTSKLNSILEAGFIKHQNDADVRKTHLFGGRYENIYLNEQHIPELVTLVNEAVSLAENILQIKNLRVGYWFNDMPPGSTTTLHTHDDDDELLSGVYYVKVPKNSGNLIIFDNEEKIEITPAAGDFIFFKPNIRHQVSENHSLENRLSIGMNFGRNGDEK